MKRTANERNAIRMIAKILYRFNVTPATFLLRQNTDLGARRLRYLVAYALHHYLGFNHREIAAVTNTSAKNVGLWIARAPNDTGFETLLRQFPSLRKAAA